MPEQSFCPSSASNFDSITGEVNCIDDLTIRILGIQQGQKRAGSDCLASQDPQMFCNATHLISKFDCEKSYCRFEVDYPYAEGDSSLLSSAGAVPDDDACLEPPDKKDILLTINFECFEEARNWIWVMLGVILLALMVSIALASYILIRRSKNVNADGDSDTTSKTKKETDKEEDFADHEYDYILDDAVGEGKNAYGGTRLEKMSGEDAYVKMDDFQESFKVYFEDRRDSVNEAPQQGGEENYVDFNPGENEYLKPLSVRLPVQK